MEHRPDDRAWMDPYGGPMGVAALVPVLQEVLSQQSHELASVRAEVINDELRDRSLADVGRQLGISKTAVHKASQTAAFARSRRLSPGGVAELMTVEGLTLVEIGQMR